jgi:AraC-like DNA-binding protein
MRIQPVTDRIAIVSRDERHFTSVRHSHARAQLIYAISGVVAVTTDSGTWVVPPSRALWVPAGVEHVTKSHGVVHFRALLIEAAAGFPKECMVVEVTPLLRELILRLATLADQAGTSRDMVDALVRLVLMELAFRPVAALALPMPRRADLARLCQQVQADPASPISIDAAAATLRTSRASFIRLFRRETGMSFARWRQQACLLKALSLLAEGRPILTVALECGYDSPSAFSAMFRRSLGRAPSDYFRPDDGAATG